MRTFFVFATGAFYGWVLNRTGTDERIWELIRETWESVQRQRIRIELDERDQRIGDLISSDPSQVVP